MIDLVPTQPGQDVGAVDTQTQKAANILAIQLRSLEYAPQIGIDLDYFLTQSFEFQNESFKSYLIEVLANNGINVSSVAEVVENLFTKLDINLARNNTGSGFIAG